MSEENQGSTREALEAAYAEAEQSNTNDSVDTTPSVERSEETEPGREVEATTEGTGQAKEAKPLEVNEPEIEPPASYRQEAKEFWKSIPRELQAEISKRELDRERYFNKAAQKFRHLEEIDQIFSPYNDQLAANGSTPAQVVRQLVAFNNLYEKDPVNTIRQLLQSKGLTIEDLATAEQPTDPRYEQLSQETQELRAWKEQLESNQANQAHEYTLRQIESFGLETDKSGQPVRPYFQDVLPTLVPIADALKRTNPGASSEEILNAAYEKAVWIHPQIRERLLESEFKTREAKRLEQQKQDAKNARATSVSVTGSPGAARVSSQGKTTREMLEEAFANQAY